MSNKLELREKMKDILREYYSLSNNREFIPGKTPILTGEAIFGYPEVSSMLETLLDGWLGLGKRGEEFEGVFSKYLNRKNSVLLNSGSSANLLALNAIKVHYGLRSGEIITPATTFPTTFNPILQLGFKPAVVDVDNTLNISLGGLEKAVNKDTVGIMFAHTLGNPAKIQEITEFADKHRLFVIEDCCDALGSRYDNKLCGEYGLISTFSFYPAHGITMGEGGLASTNNNDLKRILRSLRDWGRDCWCNTDEKNSFGACKSRFYYFIDNMYYDHKYTYSQIGYNVKPLELQAAMGLEQIKRLPKFLDIRKKNYQLYRERLVEIEKFVDFPEINDKSEPVFFGLPMILKNSNHNRKDLNIFLNDNKIATRLLFAGNILRQPAYKNEDIKVYTPLNNADKIMRDCLWIGIHPGIGEEQINYVSSKLKEYFKRF